MNYRPAYRKNKRLIKELFSTMLWLLILFFLINFSARAQTANPGIDPLYQVPEVWVNAPVSNLTKLPGNKTLIRGPFEKVNNQSKPGLARLNADGTLDNSFTADISDYTIQVMAAQSDGKIIIGGYAKNNNGTSQPALVRLNNDGTRDNSFFISLEPSSIGYALTHIAVQPDDKIIVGGGFKVKNTDKQNLVRFNADGTLDIGFQLDLVPMPADINPGEFIQGIGLQPDNKILLGGFFNKVNGESIEELVRLEPDGSIDHTFTSAVLGGIKEFAFLPDGEIIIAGTFYGQDEISLVLARLNPNGTLDTRFDAVEEHDAGSTTYFNSIRGIELLSDGKILVSGFIHKINGVAKEAPLVQINPNGSLNNTFNYQMPFKAFNSFRVLPGNSILVTGTFNKTVGGECIYLARLRPNGLEDGSFTLPLHARTGVYLEQLPDNKTLIYGSFNQVGNLSRRSLARLLSDGRLDISFGPIFESQGPLHIYGVGVLPNGQILVGGNFTKVNGLARQGLVKLNANGSIDNTLAEFEINADYSPEIRSILVLPDNRVVVSGSFLKVGGKTRTNLARLNSNGTLDESFTTGVERGAALRLLYQPRENQSPGKIIAAGNLQFKGPNDNRYTSVISRFNEDGSLDNTFTFDPSGFTSINSLAIQPDGKILMSGQTGAAYPTKLFLYHADGLPDTDFSVALNSNVERILTMVPQADGKLLVGGSFTAMNGINRTNLARLHANGTVDNDFAANLNAAGFVSSLLVLPDNNILIGQYTLLPGSNDLPVVQKLLVNTSLPTIPATPVSLVATALSGTQIGITWSDNATDELGYELESAPDANGPYTVIGSLPANVNIFTHRGLSGNTTYFYRVRARNGAGYSGYSLVAQATTPKQTQAIAFEAIPDKTFGAEPFTLVATATSGLTVTFTVVSGPATLLGNNLILTAPGQVRIKATQGGNNTFMATEAEITLCVRPAKPVIVVNGTQLAVSNGTGTAVSYQWYRQDAPIHAATSATYTATQSGEYTVVLTAGNCTSEPSQKVVINIPGSEINKEMLLFPNPATVNLNVWATEVAGNEVVLNLLTTTGSLVWQKKAAVVNRQVVAQISLKGLAKGMYLLQMQSDNNLSRHKVVVQ